MAARKYAMWVVLAAAVFAVGWWVGSSSFRSDTDNEPSVSGGVPAVPTSTVTTPAPAAPRPAVPTAVLVSRGRFDGLGGHTSWGTVTITRTSGTYSLQFGGDFLVSDGPDLTVYFGRAGEYVPAASLGPLKSLTGAQTYSVPATINVPFYDEVWIWSKSFSVPFARAVLSVL